MIRCSNRSRSCREGRKNKTLIIVGIKKECSKDQRCRRLMANRRRSLLGMVVEFRPRRRSLICHSFKRIKYWDNCYPMIELRDKEQKVQLTFIIIEDNLEWFSPELRRKLLTKARKCQFVRAYLILEPLKKLPLELKVKREVEPNIIHILVVDHERYLTKCARWKHYTAQYRPLLYPAKPSPLPNHLSLPVNRPPTSNQYSHVKHSIFTVSRKKSSAIVEIPQTKEWILISLSSNKNLYTKATFALPIRIPISARNLSVVLSYKASLSPWFHLKGAVNGKNNKGKAYMPTREIANWLYKHNNNNTRGISCSSRIITNNKERWKPRRRN